jgi:hypothetical protein
VAQAQINAGITLAEAYPDTIKAVVCGSEVRLNYFEGERTARQVGWMEEGSRCTHLQGGLRKGVIAV